MWETLKNAMAGLGYALDTPGVMARAGLLNIADLLNGEDRFQGWRASGRDVLEKGFGYAPNTPGLDLGDVLGFGVEMAVDPLNFIPGLAIARKMLSTAKIGKASRWAGDSIKAAETAMMANAERVPLMEEAIKAAQRARLWEREPSRRGQRALRSALKKQDTIDAAASAREFLDKYEPVNIPALELAAHLAAGKSASQQLRTAAALNAGRFKAKQAAEAQATLMRAARDMLNVSPDPAKFMSPDEVAMLAAKKSGDPIALTPRTSAPPPMTEAQMALLHDSFGGQMPSRKTLARFKRELPSRITAHKEKLQRRIDRLQQAQRLFEGTAENYSPLRMALNGLSAGVGTLHWLRQLKYANDPFIAPYEEPIETPDVEEAPTAPLEPDVVPVRPVPDYLDEYFEGGSRPTRQQVTRPPINPRELDYIFEALR